MVLWINKHRNLYHLILALLITCLFTWPYLTNDFLGIEHDTFFHLARIEGLASSLKDGDFFPCIYPYKNGGFGYGSPMFYCDVLLYPSALLYLCGISLASCYKFTVFLFTFVACYTMEDLVYRITHYEKSVLVIAIAYTFSNYHITDVYVRSALGEVAAMMFLPVLLSSIYELLYRKDETKWYLLAIGLTGLVLSHNLTFVLGVILFLIFMIIRLKYVHKKLFIKIVMSCFLAFLLTCWYTIPMLEQTFSQEMYVHYYAKNSSLESYTMPIWKYFVNKTVYGYGSNNYSSDKSMLVNVGWFLTFFPLLYFFLPKEKKKRKFFQHSLILGYVFLLLPIEYVPWKYLSFLRILQFPWRLELIALPLLCVVSAMIIPSITTTWRRALTLACTLFLIIEGIYHLSPISSTSFGIATINGDTTYEDITNGKLLDPYYSATYKRVELCGGDYLPMNSVDFRSYTATIKDEYQNETNISYEKNGATLSFTVGEEYANTTLVLPVTIYKGYIVYYAHDGITEKISVENKTGLVSFLTQGTGEYVLKYELTTIQLVSRTVSFITLLVLIAYIIRKNLLIQKKDHSI